MNKRLCSLGHIADDLVQLSSAGEIADQTWITARDQFVNTLIDSHITMPNHVHVIIMIHPPRRGGVTPLLLIRPSLGENVAFYKYQTTKQIDQLSNTPGTRFWQRNYHDHIIRDERDLEHHRRYILEYPLRWEQDQ